MIAHSTLDVLLSRMIITRKMRHACINVCGVKLFEDSSKDFQQPSRQNQFNQENIFNKAPVHRIAIAMITNSAFPESYTGNPFWYQQFQLSQTRNIRACQPTVDADAADNSRF